jgi:hypothetical protein
MKITSIKMVCYMFFLIYLLGEISQKFLYLPSFIRWHLSDFGFIGSHVVLTLFLLNKKGKLIFLFRLFSVFIFIWSFTGRVRRLHIIKLTFLYYIMTMIYEVFLNHYFLDNLDTVDILMYNISTLIFVWVFSLKRERLLFVKMLNISLKMIDI